MNYIKISTEEVISFSELRRTFPRTAFPKSGPDQYWLDYNGYAKYIYTPTPVVNEDEKVTKTGAELVNGQWQTQWTVQNKTNQEIEEELEKHLVKYRYEKEVGGVLVPNTSNYVQTDRESRANLIGARIDAKESIENVESFSLDWKSSSGTWLVLDATETIAIADLVKKHVKSCFSAEKNVDVSQYNTKNEVESAFDSEYVIEMSS